MIKTLFAFMMVLGLLSVGYSQSQWSDTASKIDGMFYQWNETTPGGAMMISRDGKKIYGKAFGMADLEHEVHNKVETVFESGSVAKQFTAAALYELAKEGKLSMQDDVRKYVPEMPVYAVPVTLQMLLNHTSGLRDWGSVAAVGGWPRGTRTYDREIAMEIITRQTATNFIPGTAYNYSNSNYTLMAEVVARVSGESFEKYCDKKLFQPSGMKNTKWRNPYQEVIINRAIAYRAVGGGKYQQEMPFEQAAGNGGLMTTVEDLVRWNEGKIQSLWKAGDSITGQLQRGRLSNGVKLSYAGGIVWGKLNGITYLNHTGATAGYRSFLIYVPEKKLSIAFLSNDAGAPLGRLLEGVLSTFLGSPAARNDSEKANWQDTSGQLRWAGKYRSLGWNPGVLEINSFEKGLKIKDGAELTPMGNRKYFFDNIHFQFDAATGGQSTLLRILPGEDTTRYVKVDDWKPGSEQLKEYTGNYFSVEADANATVTIKSGALSLLVKPAQPLAVIPVYKDAFRTLYTGEMVIFERDKKGKITGYKFTTGRAVGIHFMKQ